MSDALYLIDLARCTGCGACSIACKDRAGLPDDVDWLRVETHEEGAFPSPTLTYRVTHCFHCATPSCAEVCPTAAMAKRGDEWVLIDTELCIACGSCVEACPFAAVTIQDGGIATKCDGCADQVAQGWSPTCVRACPMRALHYGPPERVVPQRRVPDPAFEDHGIGPSVRYLRHA